MENLSLIVLILLSLVGYSAGAVSKAGRFVEVKPQIIDLILVVFIWTGAIYSRINLSLNKWILILIWLIIGIIIGRLVIFLRKLSKTKLLRNKEQKKVPRNLYIKLLENWKNFSNRMASFQSRIILSMFFFVFVLPFALAVKWLSDPLNIKHQSNESHWLPRKEIKIDLEQFRRQF